MAKPSKPYALLLGYKNKTSLEGQHASNGVSNTGPLDQQDCTQTTELSGLSDSLNQAPRLQFFMLTSAEHDFFLLMYVKMPTTVGILTFNA